MKIDQPIMGRSMSVCLYPNQQNERMATRYGYFTENTRDLSVWAGFIKRIAAAR
jgi:hypothetical protein